MFSCIAASQAIVHVLRYMYIHIISTQDVASKDIFPTQLQAILSKTHINRDPNQLQDLFLNPVSLLSQKDTHPISKSLFDKLPSSKLT